MVAVLTALQYRPRPASYERRLLADRPVPQATYHRRRAAFGAVAAALVLVVAVLLAGVTGAPSVSDTVGAGVPAAAPAGGDATAAHVVRPGDTVWSIARRLQPDGDIRGLVDRIVARNGGATLTAGQRVVLDG